MTMDIQTRIHDFLLAHWARIILILGTCILAFGVHLGYKQYQVMSEKNATEVLFALQSEYQDIKGELDKARRVKTGQKVHKLKKNQNVIKTDPKNFQKDWGVFLKKYWATIKAQEGTGASMSAALKLSELYFNYKQAQDYQKQLLPLVRNLSDHSIFYPLSWMLIGGIYLDMKEYKKAQESFEKITSVERHRTFHPSAFLKIGLALSQLGDVEKARTTYLHIKSNFPNSYSSQQAESFFKLS